MIAGKIQCNECRFVGDLVVDAASKGRLVTPSGWALVHSSVRISGERQLSPDKRKELKNHITKLFPPMHICPRCVFKDAIHINRMLDFKTG